MIAAGKIPSVKLYGDSGPVRVPTAELYATFRALIETALQPDGSQESADRGGRA